MSILKYNTTMKYILTDTSTITEHTSESTSSNPCSEVYRGHSEGSELETRAVTQYIRELDSTLDCYISLHSYGQLWLMSDEIDIIGNRQRSENVSFKIMLFKFNENGLIVSNIIMYHKHT